MSDLKTNVSSEDHVQGDQSAAITLVEYGDYECPYCAKANDVVKQLQSHFGDDLQYVFRNFPLTQIHEQALPAAMVAEFAATRGAFWEVHDALYENQQYLGPQLYAEILGQLGVAEDQLQQVLNDPRSEQKIQSDFQSGLESSVQGTPTFFINGSHYEGNTDLQGLIEAIEAQRNGAPGHGKQQESSGRAWPFGG